MTRVEQHKLLQELRDSVSRMSKDEQYQMEMMLKKDKDDEDLDSLSLARLNALYTKYGQKKSKQDAEEAWKKLTGGKK